MSVLLPGSRSLYFGRAFAKTAVLLTVALFLCTHAGAQTSTLTTTQSALNAPISASAGEVVTLTATVTTDGAVVPAGYVKFCDESISTASCDGGAFLGKVWVIRSANVTAGYAVGTATLRRRLSVGLHTIRARYVANTSYAASASTVQEVTVTAAPFGTTTSLASTNEDNGYSLTAVVTGNLRPTPTGPVTFLDNTAGRTLATANLDSTQSSAALKLLSAYPAQPGVTSLAVGDLNSDGYTDVVAVHSVSNSISVFMGGSGTLTLKGTITPITAPRSLVLEDFNGDGWLDIAVANGTNYFYYAAGNGDGTFGTFSHAFVNPNAQSEKGNFLAVGDFSGDGMPDLAIVGPANVGYLAPQAGGPEIAWSTSRSSLACAVGTTLSAFTVIGDRSGDGTDDLVFGCSDGKMQMQYPKPGLTGANGSTLTVALASAVAGLGSADFDEDGRPDLLAIGTDGKVVLAKGMTYTFTSQYTTSISGNFAWSPVWGDFNGDGKLDFAVTNYAATDSDPSFAYLYSGNEAWSFTALAPAPASTLGLLRAGPQQSADFNGDGYADLIAGDAGTAGGQLAVAALRSSVTVTSSVVIHDSNSANLHEVVAQYGGDTSYEGSTSPSLQLAPKPEGQTLGIQLHSPLSSEITYGTVMSGIITATASSGLPVTLSVSGPGRLSGAASGSTLTITGVGTITINAEQAGNFAYTRASTSATIAVNQATPTITWPAPDPMIYGTPLSATELSALANVAGEFAYSANSSGTDIPVSTGSVLRAGTWTLTARFTPADSSNYAVVSTPVTLVVRPAIPDIIWNQPSAIAYGTALSAEQLSATANIGGSFSYTVDGKAAAPGDVLDTGTHTLTATFTPGSTDYVTSSKQVQLVVNAASTVVTLTADSATSTLGAPVALTAAVTGNPAPASYTGAVAFYDGSTLLGQSTVSSGGVASLTAVTMGAGRRSLHARYLGLANFAPADSVILSHTVSTNPSNGFVSRRLMNAGGAPWGVFIRDFDQNATADFATVNNTTGDMAWYKGNVTAGFVKAGYWAPNYINMAAMADVDRDGWDEMITVGESAGEIRIYQCKNRSAYKTTYTSYAVGSNPKSATVGYFNNDGYPDIAVTNYDSTSVSILLGQSNGTFISGGATTLDDRPWGIAAGDINEDGKPDLAVTYPNCGKVVLLLGRGDGTFSPGGTYSGGSTPSGIEIGDVDGDGHPDLVVTDTDDYQINILQGKGDGSFDARRSQDVSGRPISVALGEFNGDGHADILVGLNADASHQNLEILTGGLFPDLAISSTHAGSFVRGKEGTLAISVTNAGVAPTSGTVTVTEMLSAGMTASGISGDGWTCTAQSVSCTRSDVLQPGASWPLITVAVTATAAPGTQLSNVALVSGTDDANSANNSVTDVIVVEKSSTTTALSADSLTYGSTVLTATVTSADSTSEDGTPTGTVTFFDGEASLGTAPLSSGTATLSASTLSAGVHSLVARYGGATAFAPSESSPALSVTVNAATPSVTTWPTASAITYGQNLQAATLTEGGTPVDGSFAFAAPNTIPDAGTAAQGLIFTPKDAANYSTVSGSVAVTVNRKALAVRADNATTVYRGTLPALSGSLEGVVGSDGITAAYSTEATSSSPVGEYAITATLVDPNSRLGNYDVTSTPGTLAITTAPTTTVLSANPLTYGSTVLTAAVSSAYGAPTGTVTFSDANGLLGTALLRSGTATLSAPTLSAGAHTLVAKYEGDAEFKASESTSTSVTVNTATPAVTTWPTASAITYGQNLQAATLTEGGASVDGSFAFTTPGTVPDAGTVAHGVIFTPKDAANYSTVSGTVAVTVSRKALTVRASDATMAYGGTLPALSGSLEGAIASDGITAAYSTTATSNSPVGEYAIAATLVDPNSRIANYNVTSTPGKLTITAAASATVSLQLSSANIYYGSPVTFTATVTAPFSSPTGTVGFYDGAKLLGSQPVTNRQAVWTASDLAVAAHAITAHYSGDTNYQSAVSAPQQLIVNAAEITVNGSTGTTAVGAITVSQNGNGTATFTLGQAGTMSGLLTLGCSGLPSWLSCTVSPASIDASKLPVTVTVNVSAATASAANRQSGSRPLRWAFGLTLPCGLLMLPGIRAGRRERILATLVGIALVTMLMLAMSGCGSGGSSTNPGDKTREGTYTGKITIAPASGTPKAVSFAVTVNK